MKRIVLLAATLIAGSQAFAGTCEDHKAELLARLEANGVKAYTLEIMPVDKVGGHKVIGSCDGGTKKIIFRKLLNQL